MLPRGTSGQIEMAPAATARWAGDAEIARFRYQPGDLLLGYLAQPATEAQATLARLIDFERSLLAATDLTPAWRDTRLQELRQHRARLLATEHLPIGVRDDRHILTVAGNRAGKGTCAIVPNLALWLGSAVTLDPKGENARLTAARRGPGNAFCKGMGQKLAVLAPYGIKGLDPAFLASWNPLGGLDPDDPLLIDKVASIAEAIVISSGGAGEHFDETGKQYIEGLILFVILNYEDEHKNLLTVHRLLMQGAREKLEADRGDYPPSPDDPNPTIYLLNLMQLEQRLDGVVSGAAMTLLDMGERERGSVLSTARRNLKWLDRPAMRAVVARSTVDLRDLKRDPKGLSVFLCLPPEHMASCGRWLRLVITAALETCYAIPEEPRNGHPVLFLLEEFPTLAHMKIIEVAAGYAAGFSVKFWFIIQDLTQIKRLYKEGWETFIGNAGVIQAFGNADATSLDYLTKSLGQVEVSQSVTNTTTSLSSSTNDPGEFQKAAGLLANRGAMSIIANPLLTVLGQQSSGQSATTTAAINQQIIRTPLILPDELRRSFRREAMNAVVSVTGRDPFALGRIPYYQAPELLGLYEPDRGEKIPLAHVPAEQERLARQQRQDRTVMISAAEEFVTINTGAIEAARSGRTR